MKKLILFLLMVTFLQARDIAVVVSNNFDFSELSKSQIKRLFLSKTNRVNNTRVRVIELHANSYKDRFYKEISGKSKSQLRSYWTTLIYTGKAKPPKQINNMNELLQELHETRNVITYIPIDEITDDMKVLYTMKD